MTRGMMKMQAKEKRMKKDAQAVTQIDGKAAREAQLKIVCSVCKVCAETQKCKESLMCTQLSLSDNVVYKIHFEAKHPKAPLPAELA